MPYVRNIIRTTMFIALDPLHPTPCLQVTKTLCKGQGLLLSFIWDIGVLLSNFFCLKCTWLCGLLNLTLLQLLLWAIFDFKTYLIYLCIIHSYVTFCKMWSRQTSETRQKWEGIDLFYQFLPRNGLFGAQDLFQFCASALWICANCGFLVQKVLLA